MKRPKEYVLEVVDTIKQDIINVNVDRRLWKNTKAEDVIEATGTIKKSKSAWHEVITPNYFLQLLGYIKNSWRIEEV